MVSAKSAAAADGPPEMTLALQAADRKERLLALRRRKDDGVDQEEQQGGRRTFVFRQRNFDRTTRQPIRATRVATTTGTAPAAAASELDTVEKRVEGLAERIIAEDAVKRMEELDLLNIAPKRANWDLRRDMDKRMKKLERKTQEAYAHLFRQRLLSTKTNGQSAPGGGGTIPSGQDLVASMDAAERERRRVDLVGGGDDEDEDGEDGEDSEDD
ncbi:hypothetical protein QFC24_001216 [Naganishia onofrii]|uniref:Uncharacterized protein n=1 Tax=Naganishia onofrii TaxID=1851511 RepID=A0ACC2XSH8_9TREE|nr:hypothetical protein QFC24_001216 [Naganishia onofrii]